MQGRLIAGIAALAACAVAACCVVPALGVGAATPRGDGNGGCSPAEGTAFSSHRWDEGDEISWGFGFIAGSGSPGSQDFDVIAAQNKSATGDESSSFFCAADVGAWNSVTSELGPGDDAVRFDAKGLVPEKGQQPYEPLGKSINTTIKGGSGADTIRGHKGFDDIQAGSGRDAIKADDGRADNVDCGKGQDKADVDNKDDVAGCEKLT